MLYTRREEAQTSRRNFKGLPHLCPLVDAPSSHGAVGVDQAGLDVLGLQEGVLFKNSLRGVSGSEHAHYVFHGDAQAADYGLTPEDVGATVIRLMSFSSVVMLLILPGSVSVCLPRHSQQ